MPLKSAIRIWQLEICFDFAYTPSSSPAPLFFRRLVLKRLKECILSKNARGTAWRVTVFHVVYEATKINFVAAVDSTPNGQVQQTLKGFAEIPKAQRFGNRFRAQRVEGSLARLTLQELPE